MVLVRQIILVLIREVLNFQDMLEDLKQPHTDKLTLEREIVLILRQLMWRIKEILNMTSRGLVQ